MEEKALAEQDHMTSQKTLFGTHWVDEVSIKIEREETWQDHRDDRPDKDRTQAEWQTVRQWEKQKVWAKKDRERDNKISLQSIHEASR